MIKTYTVSADNHRLRLRTLYRELFDPKSARRISYSRYLYSNPIWVQGEALPGCSDEKETGGRGARRSPIVTSANLWLSLNLHTSSVGTEVLSKIVAVPTRAIPCMT